MLDEQTLLTHQCISVGCELHKVHHIINKGVDQCHVTGVVQPQQGRVLKSLPNSSLNMKQRR